MSNPRVIKIIGTSGSGKTHLVREVMARYGTRTPVYGPKRKQPLGYYVQPPEEFRHRPVLAVVGHYETACGGCDTLPSLDEVDRLVRASAAQRCHVLYEGLLGSAEVGRTAKLHADGLELHVVHLTTPLPECLDSVNARRRAKDSNKPPVAEKNTAAKHRGTLLAVGRLRAAGVPVEQLNRADALRQVMVWLGCP